MALLLGWCGVKNPDDFVLGIEGFKFVYLAQFLTAYYFAYFIVILPLMGIIEKPKERPASIEAAVLGTDKA